MRCDYERMVIEIKRAGFGDGGKESWVKEWSWPIEYGKGKKIYSLLKPPERNMYLPASWFLS